MPDPKPARPRPTTARAILGKTITGYDVEPFDDGRGGKASHARITLSDGSVLYFSVQETEREHGVQVMRIAPPRRGRA